MRPDDDDDTQSLARHCGSRAQREKERALGRPAARPPVGLVLLARRAYKRTGKSRVHAAASIHAVTAFKVDGADEPRGRRPPADRSSRLSWLCDADHTTYDRVGSLSSSSVRVCRTGHSAGSWTGSGQTGRTAVAERARGIDDGETARGGRDATRARRRSGREEDTAVRGRGSCYLHRNRPRRTDARGNLGNPSKPVNPPVVARDDATTGVRNITVSLYPRRQRVSFILYRRRQAGHSNRRTNSNSLRYCYLAR